MKSIVKLLNVIFLFVIVLSLTSCKKEKVKFDFDDEYFIGVQEHIYEIRNLEKSVNTEFVYDLSKAIGAKVFRINVTINSLFYVDRNDTVKFNEATKNQFHITLNKLLEAGYERIVFANDSFIYPYGYSVTHSICVPDPYSESDAYLRWLKVNSTAYGMLAAEFPEVDYFEPINEPDYPNNEVLCRNGMMWGAGQSEYLFSEIDETNICADLCYYINKEIKKVDENNKMMTPALTSLSSTYSYLENIYLAIESGAHPVGTEYPCSTNPDDYFDIIVLHPYSFTQSYINPESPTENGVYIITDTYKEVCNRFYQICSKHGDSEKPHWYTEIGYTDFGMDSIQETIGRETTKQLKMIKEELPFVETVIFYKMCDFYEYSVDNSEDHFGLVTAPSNKEKPLELKPIMKAIYAFMHDGSTDYSEFDKVREKYCK